MNPPSDQQQLSYVLPIRMAVTEPRLIQDLRQYLEKIAPACREVLVVDGSEPAIFAKHHAAWAPYSRHIPPDPRYRYLNGKVNGLMTGVDVAVSDQIICGDDDVRYQPSDIARMSRLLGEWDYVKPQNYFEPLPLHARIESARMLVNRAVLKTGDYPGTCGFRRSVFQRIGPYDGDVLFENEEMFRHFALGAARVHSANDFFVRRLPPTLSKFIEQRPRQSYEDLIMRGKTALFASCLPAGVFLGVLASWRVAAGYAAVWCLGGIALAWLGRRREGGGRYFPADVPLFAAVWVLERALSVHLALGYRLFLGGLPYWGQVVPKGTGAQFNQGGRALKQSPH